MRNRKMLQQEREKAKMLSEQYEQLQGLWTENAMLFHDMDNHLQTIAYLASQEKCQEIQAYISRISHPAERFSGILWTGVGIVDAVLNAKRRLAEDRGYEMDINAQLPGNTGIAADDFCTILTNLLDNAIESTEQAGTDRQAPMIEVSLRHIHHFLVIRVANPCAAGRISKKPLFSGTRADRRLHGWGLKNVERAVQKYNGTLSCEKTEGKFVATAMLFFRKEGDR